MFACFELDFLFEKLVSHEWAQLPECNHLIEDIVCAEHMERTRS